LTTLPACWPLPSWSTPCARPPVSACDYLTGRKKIRCRFFLRFASALVVAGCASGFHRQAKHGADAVLVIKGVAEVDRYVNPSAILNLLILPGYFVPASHRDALFMMRAAIWDVANEFLYLSVDAEGEVRMKGPAFRIRDSDAIDSAKSLALESFGKEFLKRMHALKDAATERADSH
jgi:hypothetical protein